MSLVSLIASLPKGVEKNLTPYELHEIDLAYPEDSDKSALYEIMSIMHKYDGKLSTPGLLLEDAAKLVWGRPLTPIEDPVINNEYMIVDNKTVQSTRLCSLFSNDGGATWIDLDVKMTFMRKLRKFFKLEYRQVSFPYDLHA